MYVRLNYERGGFVRRSSVFINLTKLRSIKNTPILRIEHKLHHSLIPLPTHDMEQCVTLPVGGVGTVYCGEVTDYLFAHCSHVAVGDCVGSLAGGEEDDVR